MGCQTTLAYGVCQMLSIYWITNLITQIWCVMDRFLWEIHLLFEKFWMNHCWKTSEDQNSEGFTCRTCYENNSSCYRLICYSCRTKNRPLLLMTNFKLFVHFSKISRNILWNFSRIDMSSAFNTSIVITSFSDSLSISSIRLLNAFLST